MPGRRILVESGCSASWATLYVCEGRISGIPSLSPSPNSLPFSLPLLACMIDFWLGHKHNVKHQLFKGSTVNG